MAKRLEREFGRFDVDALDSDEYLGMPQRVRTPAYFYLLMLSGRSRKRRTNGVLTRVVADDIARRMNYPAPTLLAALSLVHMVAFDDQEVTVLKYAKWQETREEIEDRQGAARDRQARHRAKPADDVTPSVTPLSRVSHTTVTPLSHQSHTTGETFGHVTEKEIEIEIEKEIVSNETIMSLVAFDPRAERLASMLSESLDGRGVKHTKGKAWVVEADRLLRLDDRDFGEAAQLLEWATRHHFWAPVILSLPKFREKYDQLRLQRERELTQPSRPSSFQRRADQLLEEARS